MADSLKTKGFGPYAHFRFNAELFSRKVAPPAPDSLGVAPRPLRDDGGRYRGGGHHGHHSDHVTYEVWYRHDHHERWRSYGTYHSRHDAEHAAHSLRHGGHEVRVHAR